MGKSDFGLFVIKPDAVQDGIAPDIVEDIKKEGFTILATKTHQFLPDEIKYLIDPNDLAKRHKTSFGIVFNYLSGESLVLALRSENGDSIKKVRELKGFIDKGGIRKKYYPYDLKEVNSIEQSNPVQFGLMRGRNRVHCPDNEEETASLAKLIFTPNELTRLSSINGESETSSLEKNG